MAIELLIVADSPEDLQNQLSKLLNVRTADHPAVLALADPVPAAEAPKRRKKNDAPAETPPAPAAVVTPPAPPVANNPFGDAPPAAAPQITLDQFKKRCNVLIETIEGDAGFDKAAEILAGYNVQFVKDVPPAIYEQVAQAFEKAAADYKAAKAA